MAIINTGWLVNEDKVFAPKTLISQVVDNNGRTLENTLQNYNKQPYAVCYDSSNATIKNVYCDDYTINSNSEITIKFINSALMSPPIYLNVNGTNAYPIIYQGKTNYINIKANGIYKFKFTGEAWEIIGDINPRNLSDFGINVSSTEINYLSGSTENIPEQINKLKKSKANPNSNIQSVTKNHDKDIYTEPGTGYTYLVFEPEDIVYDGTVIISGYASGYKDTGAIWLKVNDINVFKVQNAEDDSKTRFYTFAYKVNAGDRVSGKASSGTTLTYYPNM